MPTHDVGDGFDNIDQALWLLTAWRSEPLDKIAQSEWLMDELRKLAVGDAEHTVAKMSAVIVAVLKVSTAFLDGWGATV
jgi:hypothetical protein